jgi:hypothetical protein
LIVDWLMIDWLLIDWLLIDWLLIDWLNTCIAHIIHSIECSWRSADGLACSQKVSHPEMKSVSAANGASFPIFPFENFDACWFLYVSTILWLTHRDCGIFIVCAWCSECVHTYTGPRFIPCATCLLHARMHVHKHTKQHTYWFNLVTCILLTAL